MGSTSDTWNDCHAGLFRCGQHRVGEPKAAREPESRTDRTDPDDREGERSDFHAANTQKSEPEEAKSRGLTQLATQRQDRSTITVASFNIQVFGSSKAKNPQVMKILAETVRRFDVVAVQELRTTDEGVMRQFVELINSEGGAYQYVVGPRLGRSNSKEQYVFVFDTQLRIEIDPSSVITVEDPGDQLHREPLIAPFKRKPHLCNGPSALSWSTSIPIPTRRRPNWMHWVTSIRPCRKTAGARTT